MEQKAKAEETAVGEAEGKRARRQLSGMEIRSDNLEMVRKNAEEGKSYLSALQPGAAAFVVVPWSRKAPRASWTVKGEIFILRNVRRMLCGTIVDEVEIE